MLVGSDPMLPMSRLVDYTTLSNEADFAGTFAYGVKDRAEILGSFLVDTRIDRDIRPLFVNEPSLGGVHDR